MSTPPAFDRLAGVYRWMEYFSFGPFLHRARTQFLGELSECRRALVLGDGDGRFTAALLRSNPGIIVHAVDGSPRMLAALLLRAGESADRVTTEVADLRSWMPPTEAHYDLVAAHFFLDCLSTAEVISLAQRLAPALQDGALWVISDFAVSKTRFGRIIALPLVTSLYTMFRWLTGLRVRELPDHKAALISAGWRVEQEQPRLKGLLISQLWRISG